MKILALLLVRAFFLIRFRLYQPFVFSRIVMRPGDPFGTTKQLCPQHEDVYAGFIAPS
jgi:hypothetical protein